VPLNAALAAMLDVFVLPFVGNPKKTRPQNDSSDVHEGNHLRNKNTHKPFIKELYNSKTHIQHLLYTRPCPEVAKGPLSDTDSETELGYGQ